MNLCTIEWNTLTSAQWAECFARASRVSLLQSYNYARAVCLLNQQRARWGLIRIDGVEAGLVQILEAGILRNALHAVILDGGPIWFAGFGAPGHHAAFLKTFNQTFPRRIGRRRRVLPTLADTPESRTLIEELGYRRRGPGYQTIWLDLTPSLEDLRRNMRSTWRHDLQKSEKAGTTVRWSADVTDFSRLLTNYQSDKVKKGYDGPSPRLLRALYGTFAPGGHLLTGIASEKGSGHDVAGMLLLLHGASATCQLVWTGEDGRRIYAGHALYGDALGILKTKGITSFDLGGTNEDSAKQVKTFKDGLGGENFLSVGHYF